MRAFAVMGLFAAVIPGAFAAGRIVDSGTTSCVERDLARVVLVEAPGAQAQFLEPRSPMDAAAYAGELLGVRVPVPCPSPQEGLVLHGMLIQPFPQPNPQRWLPSVSWSFIRPDQVQPSGIAYIDRQVQFEQRVGEWPAGSESDVPQVELGFGEDIAYRQHTVTIEPPGSDLRSSELLWLLVHKDGVSWSVQAVSPPGELASEERILATLERMIRSSR